MEVKLVDLNGPDAPRLVTESLIQSGFAVLTNHAISTKEITDFYASWEDFFLKGNPEQFLTDGASQKGYFPPSLAETAKGNDAQDLKEYFQYWPGGDLPSHLSGMTKNFFDEITTLGELVMMWLESHTDKNLWEKLERPFKDYLSKEHTLLRILRYPAQTGKPAPKSVRAAAHEDINLITMLPAANQSGLELKSKSTGEWFPVEAPAGSIVVNIGDMLQELTEGILPSTPHRVVNPTGEAALSSRMTAPVFCHPAPDLRLSERYTAGSYLEERLSEINLGELTS